MTTSAAEIERIEQKCAIELERAHETLDGVQGFCGRLIDERRELRDELAEIDRVLADHSLSAKQIVDRLRRRRGK
jgi:hypothetical protein